MSGDGRVSAIVPAFNAERFLGDAIASVLAQTRAPEEFVVVDDGSTDGTRSVAEQYAPSVRVIAQRHAGIGAARNRGLAETDGDYVAFLDADDLWLPEKTARQLRALAADPRLDVVFGHVEHFGSAEGAALGFDTRQDSKPVAGCFATTMLARRHVFARVGVFPTQLAVTEFLDWYLRLREAGLRELTVPDVVARRRVHGGNNSYRLRHRRSEFASTLKASLDRRRGRG